MTPASDPVAAVTDEVAPVTHAVTPVSNAVAPVLPIRWLRLPMGVAPVTNMVGPVSDVVALIQHMLTSVAGAGVPLTQLQSDLFSFLLGMAGGRRFPIWSRFLMSSR